jgi:hypothetical protein
MRPRVVHFLAILVGLTVAIPVDAQTESLVEQLEARMQADLDLWSEGDVDALTTQGGSIAGFGYRTRDPRGADGSPTSWSRENLTQFFNSLEYYDLELNELHAEEYGDVVVTWGFFTEDFQHIGRAPERYIVRFSSTMIRRDDGTLTTVLNHRDIQPFDERGIYTPRFR